MALDQISLTGLRVRGNHGVLEAERRDGQEFVVDVALRLDTREAGASDQLSDTADYGALAQRLAEVVAQETYDLLEALAARLAEVCLAHPRVFEVTVTVHKPQAPITVPFADVAVTVTRP